MWAVSVRTYGKLRQVRIQNGEKKLSTEDSIFSKSGFWSASKPIWSKWESKRHCPLWQAVSLACDVNPDIYLPHGLPADITSDFAFTPVSPKIIELLGQAKAAVGSGTLKVLPDEALSLMDREVDLSEFTSWLHRLSHKTPAEYPWTAMELDTDSMPWPWGSHQTKELVLLAKAAHKFWRYYDPNDPATAPTSEQVMSWLVEKGIASRKAEVMASLLRPENLPTGPRKQ